MALSAAITWEVRVAGSDNSGGGFKTNASGTDYSLFDAAQFSGTDLAVDGAVNTKVTSATHNFVAADVGNVIQITAGAGFTTGFYEIVSVSANAATLDRSPAATGTTGGTWAEGGALASVGKAAGAKVAGNDVFVLNGTYSITSASTNIAGGCVLDNTGGFDQTNASRWIGYGTTRAWGNTDTKPLLQASGAISSFTILKSTTNHVEFYNLSVDCASKATSSGIDIASDYSRIVRCKAANSTVKGMFVETGNSKFAILCEVTGASGTAGIDVESNAVAFGCEAHGNTIHGIRFSGVSGTAVFCLSYANTGASTDGFNATSAGFRTLNCTSYGNGRAGYDLTGNGGFGSLLVNCISEGNTNEGFKTDGVKQGAFLYNCGGYGNSSNYSSTNLTNVVAFQAATASFFTNAAAGDFSLNNTASAGALARAAGLPGTYPAGTSVGYLDIGGVQHLVVIVALALQFAARTVFPDLVLLPDQYVGY